jgi:hypothetical protein
MGGCGAVPGVVLVHVELDARQLLVTKLVVALRRGEVLGAAGRQVIVEALLGGEADQLQGSGVLARGRLR